MWQTMIKTLNERGLSDNEIARRVASNQSTISRIRNGTTNAPSWELAQKLIALRDSAEQKAA